MRILLTAINAKYIHSNLAVYSLKAAAGELSSHVELAEFTINHRTEEILRDLYCREPDVLLFSCYIWNVEQVKELVRECAKVMPQVPVWLGGPEVSYNAVSLLREYPELTGILTGEGEESFRLLVEAYVNQSPDKGVGSAALEEIPGAVFYAFQKQEAGEGFYTIRRNPPGAPLNLNQLSFPYQDTSDFENRIVYYESGRGCPFSCSYCLSSVDKSVRLRELPRVKKELQFFLDRNVPQIKFVDRTFNCNRTHALEIWKYLLDHDNGITNFHFEIGADLLDEEELSLLAQMRPGQVQLEIGIQSANPRTLAAVNRRMDLQRVKENVERIRQSGNIHLHLDLIAGLPYEDYKSFAFSFNEAFAMRPEQLQLGFLKLLKGTQMQQKAEEYGMVFHDKPPYEILYSNWLSFPDILKLKGIEEMVEIYYNSLQFRYTLEKLIPLFPTPFAFFEELSEDRGMGRTDERKHSRLQRYELLLDFICRRFPGQEKVFREALTVDLYLRENRKSRPDFAPPQEAFRETIRELLHCVGREKHVEILSESGGRLDYLVFDYGKRDPLTNNAALTQCQKET